MRSARRFEVVLFDLGSTLIYFDGVWYQVMAESIQQLAAALKQNGFDIQPEKFIPMFQERLRTYYIERDKAFIEFTTEYVLYLLLEDLGIKPVEVKRLRPCLDAMYAVTEAHWHAEVDAVPMLSILKEEGYKLGLVSNAADVWNVYRLLDKNKLKPYFELVLISASVGIRKPHPRIFLMALDHFRVRPSQVVMVGDTLSADILGARQVDIASVWINRWSSEPGNRVFEDAIFPDAVISRLSELPDLLRNWE